MKVVLVRLDGIGDALACAPLVAALRDAGHELGAVLSTRNRDAFAARAFARVHALERIPWPAHGSTPESRRAALAEARAARYDVALVASEELDAYAFARDARVPSRVGFTTGWAKPFKSVRIAWLVNRRVARRASASATREHEVETLFRLGTGLHAEAAPTRDVERLRPLLLDDAVAPHRRVVVQATDKLAAHGLDADAYATLLGALERAFGDLVVVADDRSFAARLRRRANTTVEVPPTLGAWKRRLAGALAVVTPDSGAAHVAGMLGVPCVDLFPATNAAPYDVVRWRPWAAPSRPLVVERELSPGDFASRVVHALDALLTNVAG